VIHSSTGTVDRAPIFNKRKYMQEPRYVYFKPNVTENILSEHSPSSTNHMFPIGTQCLDTKTNRVFELFEFDGGTKQEFIRIGAGPSIDYCTLLKVYVLLSGITVV